MNQKIKCDFCGTKIPWEDGNTKRGAIFWCENPRCQKAFCTACFIERHGADAWKSNASCSFNEALLCPDCYEEAKGWIEK